MNRLVARAAPRRVLLAELAEMTEEIKELREASVRRSKDCQALRAEIARLTRESAE